MPEQTPRPRWRTGRRQPRTLYLQLGDQPSSDDPMMGALDTADLAALVVDALNTYTGPLADVATSNWLVLCDALVAARAEITDLRRNVVNREARLQTPDEWIAELMPGAKVVDPDGWRDDQLWTTRISRAEFEDRIAGSTVNLPPEGPDLET